MLDRMKLAIINLVDYVTDTKIGDLIHKYRDAQDCVGELLLKYECRLQMDEMIENMDQYFHIVVK